MKTLDKTKQVTLEFKTKAERDEWMKWYAKDGATHFFGWILTPYNKVKPTKRDRKWRAYAEEKMKNWPKDNERFV